MMRKGLRISTGGVIRTSGGLQITVPPSAGSPPGESSALVSGAGDPGTNTTYDPAGTFGGKSQYFSATLYRIFWDGTDRWTLTNDGGDPMYEAVEDTTFPWETAAWVDAGGGEPAPTVTEA